MNSISTIYSIRIFTSCLMHCKFGATLNQKCAALMLEESLRRGDFIAI